MKPFAADELLARVHALMRRATQNGVVVSSTLTPRELEILELLAEGLRQSDIAERLVISPKTVGTHVGRILAKLGVRSRVHAVAVAYRDGLLEPAPLST